MIIYTSLYPNKFFPKRHCFSLELVLIPEVKYGRREAGVHDDQAGESLRGVLDHAQTSEAAPILAHQGQVLQLQDICALFITLIYLDTSR